MNLQAADIPGFLQIPSAKLDGIEQTLKGRVVAGKPAFSTLQRTGNSAMALLHRDSTGPAELHDEMTDVFVVRSGEAFLDLGGRLEGATELSPGEYSGTAVVGGTRIPMRPGDVIRIPAKLPHHVVVASGRSVTYLVMKFKD